VRVLLWEWFQDVDRVQGSLSWTCETPKIEEDKLLGTQSVLSRLARHELDLLQHPCSISDA